MAWKAESFCSRFTAVRCRIFGASGLGVVWGDEHSPNGQYVCVYRRAQNSWLVAWQSRMLRVFGYRGSRMVGFGE